MTSPDEPGGKMPWDYDPLEMWNYDIVAEAEANEDAQPWPWDNFPAPPN